MSGPRRPLLSSRHTRWSYVRTLDKGTAVGVARPVDLQRRYRSPTHVPNSHACGRLSRRWPTALVSETPAVPCSVPAHALELCTYVGQRHSRWSCTARRSPTPVPISNACTQLSRLWADMRPDPARSGPRLATAPTPTWTTAPTPAPAPLNSSRTTAADGGRLRLNPRIRSVPKRPSGTPGTGLTSSLSQGAPWT